MKQITRVILPLLLFGGLGCSSACKDGYSRPLIPLVPSSYKACGKECHAVDAGKDNCNCSTACPCWKEKHS